MSGWGGLLTVVGGAGEGGFKGMNKNLDEAIERRKEKALEKRWLNLEKVRQKYSQENAQEQHRMNLERDVESDKMRAGRDIAKSGLDIQRDVEQSTLSTARDQAIFDRESKLPGPVGKTFKDLEEIFGTEKAKEILLTIETTKANKDKDTTGKLISETYIKTAKALGDGTASLSAANASLEAIKAPMRFQETEGGGYELVPMAGEGGEFDLFSSLLERSKGKSGTKKEKAVGSTGKGLLEFNPTGSRVNATMTNPPW